MRKILSVLAVSLGVSLAVAVAAEVLFGTWFSKDPLDQLGLPRDSVIAVSPDGLYDGGHDFLYRRDHWGFRGAGVEPSRVAIVTLGGSTTNQSYLPDDATWQAVLQRELQAAGRDVIVGNAGIDDQSTFGHLRALEEWFPRVPGLKPHFVVFYVGINDARAEEGHAPGTLRDVSRVQWLRARSALWQAGARLAHTLDASPVAPDHRRLDLAAARWTDKPEQPDWRPEGDAGLAAYQGRLRRLAEATHAMGAVPVFVTQTRADFKLVDGKVQGMVEEGGLNGVDHYRRLAAVNRATREVCADEGLLCLDLAREVTFEPGDFYDYLHNTPQGAAKIGRWLAAKLAGLV